MNYKDVTNLINKGTVPNVMLFYGPEVYLIDKAVKAIKKKFIDSGFESINYSEIEQPEQNFDFFYEFAITFPFMSDKKMCVVNECEFLTSTGSLGKAEEDKIIKIIEENNDTCIIVLLVKNGKADARKRIVKKLKEKNAVFEMMRIDENELNKYISDRFKSENISISMSDANYIAVNSGYLEYEGHINLYDVNNEIDKLVSFCTDTKRVSRSDIDKIMIKSIESSIFKLVDYICEGRKDLASEIMGEMLLNNTPEPYIMFMIIRQYRLLYHYVVLYRKGYNINDIMDKMKIKKFIATKLAKQAKNLTVEKIQDYMEIFMDIDRKIKVGEIDKRIGLELITNGIC